MHLSGLELAGFKSFAKKATLTFDTGITCIVGPNGSGKSAIADAIRWVLGEQSLKSIRAKRGEDVIFQGSRARARVGMADVTMTLADAEQAGLDVPELALTRTIDRAGESAYLVNGRPVRLLDLADLLAKAGFAQKSYTVIPQGMIDAFVTASPFERRQMFEDATGVTPLLLKQEQTERKLESTRTHTLRARDLLRELEPRLRTLKRQASRARGREEVETRLREAEEQFAAYRWQGYTVVLHAVEEKLRSVEERIVVAASALDHSRGAHTAALPSPERLPELRRTVEVLRGQERELLLALARAEARQEGDVDRVAEEIMARRKEQEKFTHALTETRTAMTSIRAERQQLDHAMHEAQEAWSAHGDTRPTGENDLGRLLHDMRTRATTLCVRLRAVTRLEALPGLVQEAETLAQLMQDLATMVDRSGTPGSTDVGRLRAAGERLRDCARANDALGQRAAAAAVREAELRERLRFVEERLALLQRQRPASGSPATEETVADVRARLATVQQELTSTGTEVARFEDALLRAHLEQEKTLAEERQRRDALHAAEQEKAALAVEHAGTSARQEELLRETTERLGDEFARQLSRGALSPPLPSTDPDALRAQIEHLRKQLFEIGGMDNTVLEEEGVVERRVTDLHTQVADLDAARKNLRAAIHELEQHIHERFTTSFRAMDDTFNRMFREIFEGGRASLSLVKPKPIEHAFADLSGEENDRQDPSTVEETGAHVHELPVGVEIHVHPPGKKLQNLAQLSGGEKALTSIALLFAVLEHRASPFVVLDEVDAALDESNSRRFARLLQAAAQRTQFIVITHNRATMEAARALYGVTMGDDGVSQLLSIKLEEVPGGAAARANAGS